MKTGKPAAMSKRSRALEQQVQEYVDCSYPHWGDVAVEISPSGTLAVVRNNTMSKVDHSPKTAARRAHG
jgi:hypothetical protein